MATTADISISSDIIPGFGSYTKSMTLTEAGNTINLKETTGYSRRKLATASKVDLVTMANLMVGEDTTNLAHKIFIKNIGYNGEIDKTKWVKVFINAIEVGLLYGGDWMMCPVVASDGEDIEVQAEDDNAVVLEWVMFYQ